MKDILIFLSDQHSPLFSEFAGGMARTPNLNRLCAEGVSFESCQTPCPLCVPARMAMLSGWLPSETGVMLNLDTLPDLTPTFLHPFAAAGYDTVLIGRMHFIGRDQRHGFTRRLAQDMTPVTWNRPEERLTKERGVFHGTYDARGCVRVIGGGDSPVLRYDETVVQAALDYLSLPHERPQLIVVGTYAPHFPYVAPSELYREYRAQVKLPPMFHETPDDMNPLLVARKNVVGEDTALAAQAAYLGMITYTDGLVGRVRAAFDRFTAARGSEGLFGYCSDHGDQVGMRDLFGKCTFYEPSVRVPLILARACLPASEKRGEACSLIDLGPTLCAWAQVGAPMGGGADLLSDAGRAPERIVVSQMMEQENGVFRTGLMLRKGRWKYIVYSGYEDQETLFDLQNDPMERVNRALEEPDVTAAFREYAKERFPFAGIEREQEERRKMARWMQAWERLAGEDDSERWKGNTAKDYPELREGAMP